jgi:hypothetical protein
MNLAARMWVALTWRHWAWAIGLGVLVPLLMVMQTFHINTAGSHWRVLYGIPWFVTAAVIFVLAVGWAEASERRGVTSPWRYAAGAAVASVAWLVVLYAAKDFSTQSPTRKVADDMTPHVRNYDKSPKSSIVVTVGFEGVVHGWLAILIYARLRSLRAARRALAAAELQRAVASRDLLDTQLREAHELADPERVLAELDEVERLYGRDPAMAGARLEELITFLRAAIPAVPAHADGDPR